MYPDFNSIKVRLNRFWWFSLHCKISDFNSIKVRLNLIKAAQLAAQERFQFHKGTIKPVMFLPLVMTSRDFNSIKVRLNPIVLGNAISLFTSIFKSAKVRFFIEKMSMDNYVFFYVLRQPFIFIGVTTCQRSKWCLEIIGLLFGKTTSTTFIIRNCRLTSFLFQESVCSYYTPFYW